MPDSPSTSRLSPLILATRDGLSEAHQAIRQQHDRGLDPVQVCGKLTAAADTAIRGIFDGALADLPSTDAEALRKRVCLVAHGGYGRRHMAPFSDIDLMILFNGKQDGPIEELASRLTKDICDIRVQLGQTLRTVDEAVSFSRTDPVTCTSLIESRHVAGDVPLFEEFRTAFAKSVRKRSNAASIEFVEARRAERVKYGETVYLLEPNIKRSRGGLRDLHLLRWLWFAHAGISDLDQLRRENVLSKFDHRRLTSSRDFLLRVRNEAHFSSGKARDLLNRGEQLPLAEKLGYRGREGMLPVEQFMRDYFRHAGHIWFLAARISELSTRAKRTAVATVFGAVFSRSVERDYRIDDREITATEIGRAKLQNNLDEALRLVDLARLSDRRISQDTWYWVYRTAPTYSNALTDIVRERFLDIMDKPQELGGLLRRMHDLGVLEKIIPEYTHARCLLQFNQYHKFTVDEHCIRTVEKATRFADRQDQLGEAYRQLRNKRQLHLALLIHDLGKGHEEDHSELGVTIAQNTGQRLGLSYAETTQLKFLVHKHLVMPRLALKHDMNDTKLIASFAEEVGSVENLQLLYLLSCADLAGVGPGVLNAWKVEMLTELYARAKNHLRPNEEEPADRRGEIRELVWQQLDSTQQRDTWLSDQFAVVPESFLTSRSPAAVAETLQKLRALKDREAVVWGESKEGSGTAEFLAGVEKGLGRGVFSSLAGALSAAGMQILAAETAVLENDMLLLRYVAGETNKPESDVDQTIPRTRIDEICNKMLASIDSEKPPSFPHIWGSDQQATEATLTSVPNEVRIDAELSDRWLIVEVYTVDRRGLLYELARAVHELSLVIRFARIATSLDQVVDVFYVSEPDGSKPKSEERIEQIRSRLAGIIDPDE